MRCVYGQIAVEVETDDAVVMSRLEHVSLTFKPKTEREFEALVELLGGAAAVKWVGEPTSYSSARLAFDGVIGASEQKAPGWVTVEFPQEMCDVPEKPPLPVAVQVWKDRVKARA